MQYVHTAPRVREAVVTRSVTASPLMRTMYASRTRTIPAVYHPRYIVGRVSAVRTHEIIVDPPAGAPVIVRDVVVGSTIPAVPVGTVVTLPVTYANGSYQYVAPAYPSYGTYGYNTYAPQYGYAYAPPVYCSGNSSTALYAALIPTVIGLLSGDGGNLNSSSLASAALTAAAGGNGCATPSYYAAPVNYGYAAPVSTYSAPYYNNTYATPYDNCLNSDDQDGDENGCATSSPYTYDSYSNYSPYSAYTPQQVQGIVIARSGDTLMVLGSGGTPTFVYAAPAMQSGFTVNGPIQPGQFVDAYGYYNGNTFIATALV
ncbi:MAG TPA: hypothetical protein VFN37_12635 [Candidatus Baltobacteraceae bacterium]|nr:hypothetical protein [Candidatus Baltobacteraceae bacterium]